MHGNVKAPTLIMGDVGDPNVPLVNSYEWYHALRDNGVRCDSTPIRPTPISPATSCSRPT